MNPRHPTTAIPWRTFAAAGLVSAGLAAAAAGMAMAHVGPFASPPRSASTTRLVSAAPAASPLQADELFKPTAPPPAPDQVPTGPADPPALQPADSAAAAAPLTPVTPRRSDPPPMSATRPVSPTHAAPSNAEGEKEHEPSPVPSVEPSDRPEPAQTPEPSPSPEISQ